MCEKSGASINKNKQANKRARSSVSLCKSKTAYLSEKHAQKEGRKGGVVMVVDGEEMLQGSGKIRSKDLERKEDVVKAAVLVA